MMSVMGLNINKHVQTIAVYTIVKPVKVQVNDGLQMNLKESTCDRA